MRRATLCAAAVVAALLVPAAAGANWTASPRHAAGGSPQGQTAKPRKPRTPPTGKPPKPPVKPPPVTPPPAPAPKPLARLQVIAREFSLTLSRTALAAGPAAIELDNLGQDPHDLRVERVDDPAAGFSFSLAKPRTVATRKLELGAGEWKLYCTLPGHEALGMSARITVTG